MSARNTDSLTADTGEFSARVNPTGPMTTKGVRSICSYLSHLLK
jgi:hypothetical protein